LGGIVAHQSYPDTSPPLFLRERKDTTEDENRAGASD